MEERVDECVCVWARERGFEGIRVCVREKAYGSSYEWVCERERENKHVCVCTTEIGVRVLPKILLLK